MKVKLPKSELILQFQDNLEKIESFCAAFDNGKISIAQEISVKLRILFHNTNNSKSLLRQLKLEKINFLSTSNKYKVKNKLNHHGLLLIITDLDKSNFAPRLDDGFKKEVSFENWWDSEKIIAIKNQIFFTRKKIILELADTDGGAHVDGELKEEYFNLSRMNSLGWKYHDNKLNKDFPFNNPVPLCIRQIAYEVLLTFKNLDLNSESRLFSR